MLLPTDYPPGKKKKKKENSLKPSAQGIPLELS